MKKNTASAYRRKIKTEEREVKESSLPQIAPRHVPPPLVGDSEPSVDRVSACGPLKGEKVQNIPAVITTAS